MSSPRGFLVGGIDARSVNGEGAEAAEVDLVGFDAAAVDSWDDADVGGGEGVGEDRGMPDGGVGADGRRREKGNGTKGMSGVGWTRMLRCMLSDRSARLA